MSRRQIQGFFGPRTPVDNLWATPIAISYFLTRKLQNVSVVAPDAGGSARGGLYLDGGDGYGYRDGVYAHREYVFATAADGARTLRSIAVHANSSFAPPNLLERVELLGLGGWRPVAVTLEIGGTATELGFSYSAERQRLVVRKPAVAIASDFTITLK